MIIKYKFSTGEVTEVEVSEEIGTVILDSRREEHASNERHRYHTAFSLDDMDYEDKDYFSAADNPEKAFMEKEFAKKREAMERPSKPRCGSLFSTRSTPGTSDGRNAMCPIQSKRTRFRTAANCHSIT